MKEDVFMSLPVSGKTYTFECLGAEGMFLNLYYSNGVSDGQNVILWEGDGSLEQQWKYNGSKLLTVRNTNFALDKYTVSGSANNNNADVWTANDPTNQNIVFVVTSSGDNVVKIKLTSSKMYLTAYGFENGTSGGKIPTSIGNVYWTSSDKGSMQQWICREVGASNGQYLALPLNTTIINVGYKNYAPGYNLSGRPSTHYGVDFIGNSFENDKRFFASGDGIVLGVNSTYIPQSGYTVGKWLAIKYFNVNGYGDLIVRYFHLDNIAVSVNQEVTLDTVVATYGQTGDYVTGPHLHVEVDTDTNAWNYTPTLASPTKCGLMPGLTGEADTTVNPLDVFKRKISEPEKQTCSVTNDGVWCSGISCPGSFE